MSKSEATFAVGLCGFFLVFGLYTIFHVEGLVRESSSPSDEFVAAMERLRSGDVPTGEKVAATIERFEKLNHEQLLLIRDAARLGLLFGSIGFISIGSYIGVPALRKRKL